MVVLSKMIDQQFAFLSCNLRAGAECGPFEILSNKALKALLSAVQEVSRIDVEEATSLILKVLDGPMLKRHCTMLIDAVNAKCDENSEEIDTGGNDTSSQQLHMFFHFYLTEKDWNTILDPKNYNPRPNSHFGIPLQKHQVAVPVRENRCGDRFIGVCCRPTRC